MDVDKYLKQYSYVSRREIEQLLDYHSAQSGFTEDMSESSIRSCHKYRETEKICGRHHVNVGPAIHIFSMCLRLTAKQTRSVSGAIYAEFYDEELETIVQHDLYRRQRNDGQLIDLVGNLTLIGPSFLSDPEIAFIPMHQMKIVVELYDESSNVLICEHISLDDIAEHDFEKVSYKCVQGKLASLGVEYVAIPYGTCCRVKLYFIRGSKYKNKKPLSLDIYGKVFTRYNNTLGNYSSQETVLYEKSPDEFEQVNVSCKKSILCLSRYWVTLPVYSSIIFDVDLSEYGTGKTVIKETVEFRAEGYATSSETFRVGDTDAFVRLVVAWFPGQQRVPYILRQEDESSYDEMYGDLPNSQETSEEERDVMQAVVALSNINLPWDLSTLNKFSYPSVELFSLFIGRENFRSLKLYGSIEVLCDYNNAFYLFKRDVEDSMSLLEHHKTAPISEGFQLLDDDSPLKIKVELKDLNGCIDIKGFVVWNPGFLVPQYDELTCSVIQGERGFVALYYAVFSNAVQAKIHVVCRSKSRSANFCPKVYGSFVAYYSRYDYSSHPNRDYYRIVLFKRERKFHTSKYGRDITAVEV